MPKKAEQPGPALTGVAFAIFGRIDIQRSAAAVVRGLSEEPREMVRVGMLDGANVRFVAAVEGPAAVRVASRLGRELSQIRERGCAVNREEGEDGVASVAVAIPTGGPGLRLALNAAAPLNRLDVWRFPAVAAALTTAAKAIGDQLG